MRLILFIALRQLWDRRLLNGIALAGVALGVLVLITMSAIMQGFQMKFKGEILKISPHVTIFDKKLEEKPPLIHVAGPALVQITHQLPLRSIPRVNRPKEVIRALERLPDVLAACGSVVGQAIVTFGNDSRGADLRGVEPDLQERCTPITEYIRHGSWADLDRVPDGVVMGGMLADELDVHVGDRLAVVAPGGTAETLKLVGIFSAGIPPIDRTRIYVNIASAQRILRRPEAIGRIDLRLADPFASETTAARMERILGYDAEGWQESNKNYLALYDLQNNIIKMVEAAMLIVGGFGVLAVLIMIVLQKTRDIAILRAVGYRRGDILAAFMLQGLVLSFLGTVVGELCAWRLIRFLAGLKVNTVGPLVSSSTFMIYEDPIYYVYGFVFALLVGVLASTLPAWRASKVEPVDVLRGHIG